MPTLCCCCALSGAHVTGRTSADAAVSTAASYMVVITCNSVLYSGVSGLLTPDMRKASSVGNAFIDTYSTDAPYSGVVSVGSASASIELDSAEECGVDGCEGLLLTADVARAYAVPKAISFKGSGVPADCPYNPIDGLGARVQNPWSRRASLPAKASA